MSVHTEPGDNRRYIEHSLRMWDWPSVDMKQPPQVKERIGMYLSICAEDDMKPSVAGLALAFGVSRKTISLTISTLAGMSFPGLALLKIWLVSSLILT